MPDPHHPTNRRWNVTILRTDGTEAHIDGVKHIIAKQTYFVLYVGEHNVNRVQQWWPADRIDHMLIEEASVEA